MKIARILAGASVSFAVSSIIGGCEATPIQPVPPVATTKESSVSPRLSEEKARALVIAYVRENGIDLSDVDPAEVGMERSIFGDVRWIVSYNFKDVPILTIGSSQIFTVADDTGEVYMLPLY